MAPHRQVIPTQQSVPRELVTPAAATPTPAHRRRIAYVLPVYNESGNIERFYDALSEAVAARPDLDFQFVYIDDGSRDDSLDQLLALRERDPRVTVLGFSRNYGHQIAVTAGLDVAHAEAADAVIVMDTDLQDPPSVSVDMIRRWEAGAEVVYAQRASRKDTLFKRATAAAFYALLDRVAETPIPRHVGDFRLMDARVVAEVAKYREHSRFIRGIVANVGFRQEAVLFDRDARFTGRSNYSFAKMLRLAADGLFGFSTFPLQIASQLGLVISVLSGVAAVYAVGAKILQPETTVPGWTFLGVGIFFMGGVQLIMIGLVGSYVGRTYIEVLDRPLYTLAMVARGGAGHAAAGTSERVGVALQPLLGLPERRILGWEALVHGHGSPSEAVPAAASAADRLHLLDEITREVLDQALDAVAEASRTTGERLVLSVSVEPEQLTDGSGLVAWLRAEERVAEVTVVLAVSAGEGTAWSPAQDRVADELAERGVRLALADPGGGLAPLVLLASRSWEWVALGRDLLEPGREAILPEVVALLHRLDAGVLLHGVDTDDRLAVAERLGVRVAHGLASGGALPVHETVERVRAHGLDRAGGQGGTG